MQGMRDKEEIVKCGNFGCEICFNSVQPAQHTGAYRPNWTAKRNGWYRAFTYLPSELDDPGTVRL